VDGHEWVKGEGYGGKGGRVKDEKKGKVMGGKRGRVKDGEKEGGLWVQG